MQVYEDDGEEKIAANMNMGPRTWYQVPPRDLRYPEVKFFNLYLVHTKMNVLL